MDDGRLHFPATARNREAIAEVLEPLLPQRGLVLEIASGSGEHLCHFQQQFAASHPLLRWQGSDPDPLHRCSLQAWADALGLSAMAEPLDLDATAVPWPALDPALILCINMIHIAPWAACQGLLAEAGRQLPEGGQLVLYGPFVEQLVPTSPSNEAFDASLRSRDPVGACALWSRCRPWRPAMGCSSAAAGPCPPNNLTVAFRRSG